MKIFEVTQNHKRKLNEAKARIDHPEDIMFDENGIEGAQRALSALTHAAESHHETTTIKWDGCIHPDHVLQTDKGELRIEEVIDRIQYGEQLFVLGHDLNNSTNIMTEVVCAVKKHGAKDWVEVILENGDCLRLTKDHEVYTTNRGWVEAKDLTANDDVKEL
jgi:hypothetical protein